MYYRSRGLYYSKVKHISINNDNKFIKCILTNDDILVIPYYSISIVNIYVKYITVDYKKASRIIYKSDSEEAINELTHEFLKTQLKVMRI